MAKKKTDKLSNRDSKTEISFERSFEELQEIVSRLEDGRLTLGESLKNYEIGITRLKECYHALNQAENRIRILNKLDADGNLDMSDFDLAAADETNARSGRRSQGKTAEKNHDDDPDGLF